MSYPICWRARASPGGESHIVLAALAVLETSSDVFIGDGRFVGSICCMHSAYSASVVFLRKYDGRLGFAVARVLIVLCEVFGVVIFLIKAALSCTSAGDRRHDILFNGIV